MYHTVEWLGFVMARTVDVYTASLQSNNFYIMPPENSNGSPYMNVSE